MTRAFADPGQRPSAALADLLSRVGAEVAVQAERMWAALGPVRHWGLRRLVQTTILTCAAMAVIRRSDAYAQFQQRRRSLAVAARREWARAEGFEMEAGAGIALVVLAVVILAHAYVVG